MSSLKEDALKYHSKGRPGKISVVPTKPTNTTRDLSLAYSPGVAEPCIAIAENVDDVYKYTAKGNLVAVISNGTAVLGLGDIGPEASKPVMEGKGVLFKIFADIDVFDIEISTKDTEEFIRTVKNIAVTFGGINLEDIKAPECFEIEQRLKEELDIPIMHDDQHGTAIITGAALLNALELVGKKIENIQVVYNGAGAAAVSCARIMMALGVKKENLIMCDSKGVIRSDNPTLDHIKRPFATERDIHKLEEAMKGADVFVGLSKADVVSQDMLRSMNKDCVVFALANPNPEITYELAMASRPDIIMATGRSDYPNQVNNVLGFPYIFRGALDVRATKITEEMKLAAVYALAKLTKEPVPEIVNLAYNESNVTFGRNYIIPKPIDPRLITTVSPAVAKAAMECGVAKLPITDWEKYHNQLLNRLGKESNFTRAITDKAKMDPKRVVFSDADNYKILRAAQIVKEEKIATPILLGNRIKIEKIIAENNIKLAGVTIIDPMEEEHKRNAFADVLFRNRQRNGLTIHEARKLMRDRHYYAPMMVEMGEADAMISGLTKNYPTTIRPALQILGKEDGAKVVAGMYIMLSKKGPLFFADCSVNQNPTEEELMDIAVLTNKAVKKFNINPRMALLSYSNFGSAKGEVPEKMARVYRKLKAEYPNMVVDGDIQANVALSQKILKENFPFSELIGEQVNTFVFPSLAAGNITYKMLQELGAAEAIGPILLGLKKSAHILQLGSSVREIVNMVTIAVVDAQSKE
ncbi:MAG: NADP-dependent malic enzyme [Bacteroidia bacterium]|nr:NADP-dependent malic enzyme [Bacteroidia bacterium]MCF8425646.1 NADP-dependent malic enzyme [Bacteroidia bacterium]MCF8446839.1 NADP-dependent malic enzyme [Bacteroidia bacterium]